MSKHRALVPRRTLDQAPPGHTLQRSGTRSPPGLLLITRTTWGGGAPLK